MRFNAFYVKKNLENHMNANKKVKKQRKLRKTGI